MRTIESTPELVSSVYQKMESKLQVVRDRLNRPMTMADKVLLSHLEDPAEAELIPGESYILLNPDRVLLQDVLGQTAMLNFMQTGRDSTVVPTSVHCDHLIQARVEGASDLKESLQENDEVYDFLRSAAAKYVFGGRAPVLFTKWHWRIMLSPGS